MKLIHFLLGMLALFTAILTACGGGNGASGSSGTLAVTAVATGSTIKCTATYTLAVQSNSTNPVQTNLAGVPVNFSVQIGAQTISLGTSYTNSSGIAVGAFVPPAFSGTQTITVIGQSGGLRDFFSLTMSGSTLTVTPPPTLALTTAGAAGTSVAFIISPSSSFVTITDPFGNDISNHQITISASFVSGNGADTLTQPNATTTSSVGTADFPGTSGTLITPSTVSGVDTMTITWRVTDTTTGQTGTAITTVTLTKTS